MTRQTRAVGHADLDSEQYSQVDSTDFLRARFTHGSTIMLFTTLLKIPILRDKQTPVNETYTYENNGWHGELVSVMSANVQWDIYRHKNDGKTRSFRHQQLLIRMLLNEYPVTVNYIIQ
jgi:hypothetical protein